MEEMSEKIKMMLGQEEEAQRNLKIFSTIIKEVKNKRQISNCNKIIKCVLKEKLRY